MKRVFQVLALAAAYYVSARLGLYLSLGKTNATPVWPPSGIAFAAVLLWGGKILPGIALGAFLANIITFTANQAAEMPLSLGLSAGIAAGNTLEALTGAWLLGRWLPKGYPLERSRDVFRFMAVALLMSLASACVGPTLISLAGISSWADYDLVWLTWWFGDVSSILVITPFFLAWVRRPRLDLGRWAAAEYLTALSVLAASCLMAEWPFILIPPLIWIAFRFEARELSTAILLATSLCILATLEGLGPFQAESENESLLLIQAFVIVAMSVILATGVTVTQRRRAEHDLMTARDELEIRVRERTSQLREVEKIAHLGSWSWDVVGNRVEWNDELYRIHGIEPQSLPITYDGFLRLVFYDDWRGVEDAIQKSVRDGRPFVIDYRITRPNGEVRWLHTRAGMIQDASGVPVRMVGTALDITETRKMQDLQREKEAAEAGNRAKSQFLAMVSHEMRTPLNAVMGFARLLTKKEGSRDDSERALYLDRIMENSQQLLHLIGDLLDLARIEAGRMKIEISETDLGPLVADILQGFEEKALQKGLWLRSNLPQEIARVQTDPIRTRQILGNLVGNAIKFTQKGGITVRIKPSGADERPLKIEVEDTGVGIPPERLGLIFMAFEQGDSGTARRFGGSGLGLAICHALAGLMGHQVKVQSRLGEGSTFSLVFEPAEPSSP